jgi:hypothetical protein
MRGYDVAVASLAIDAPTKWTDNVLSQHDVPGVVAARRGVTRRITRAALLHLALTRELHVGLGMGVRDALSFAHELLALDAADMSLARASLRLGCDHVLLERTLDQRLREALESAPVPRRGRPPRRRSAQ